MAEKWEDAPLQRERWEDAPVVAEPRASNDEPSVAADIAWKLPAGINSGVDSLINLPYNLIRWPTNLATGRETLPDVKYLRRFNADRPAETTPGRFAEATGEAIGSSILPTGFFLSKAEKLAKLKPETVPRAFGERIGAFFAETPGRAVAADAVGATAAGVGQQMAREAGLGPGFEIAAGAAAPVVPVAVATGGERILRRGAEAISPTLARWRANGDAILRKLGVEASADGGLPPNVGAQAASDQIIANQLRRAGLTVDDIETALTSAAEARRFHSSGAAQDALAPVDLDPSLQRLAGSLVRSSPEAANVASDFMYARQSGLSPARGELPPSAGLPTRDMLAKPKAGAPPMGQMERVRDAMKRALLIRDEDFHGHAANANRTDQAILRAAREEAQALYGDAYAAGGNINVRPTVEPVLDRWRNASAEEPGPVSAAIKRGIRLFETERGPVTSVERFDKAKQYLDGEIEKLFESAQGRNRYLGGVLTKFKNELLDAVDNIGTSDLGTKYKAARGAYGSHMESREALQMGRDAFKADSDIGVDAFRSLADNPGQQKLFRLGLLSGFEKQAGASKRTADITQIFENPRIQELLSEVIPRSGRGTAEFADRPERFGRYLGNEKTMIQTRNEVAGNSKTAQRLADDEAYEQLQAVFEQFHSPSILGYAKKITQWSLNKAFGYRADTAAAMADDLFTADPARRAQLLARVRERMGQERFVYFSHLMQQQRQQLAPAKAAAVTAPPAVSHQVPPDAVEYLQNNANDPFVRRQFEDKYGVSADQYLGAK